MAKETIETGKFVSLTYSIADQAGNVVEQSDLPVNYIFGGETELIGDMDKAVFGKSAGDVVRLDVPPEQGFGEPDPALTFTDDIENVPLQFRRLGAEVEMRNDRGEAKTFHVTQIKDGTLTVDGNHPLAGKTLSVTVRILQVRDATDEDRTQSVLSQQMPPTIN